MKRLTVDIDDKLHTSFKIACTLLNDRNKGLFRISNMLDYTQEVSEEKLEKFLFDSVSIYLFQEPGKFPPKKKEKLDMSPEDFEDIDDSPPNDQGLEDLDITTEDFKL